MARKSFTLQKYTSEYGSYVAYPAGFGTASSPGLPLREDDDSRLKSDGLLLPPRLSSIYRVGELIPYASYFDAEVIGYDEIRLTWDAFLFDVTNETNPDNVVPTELFLVYSEEGEPQTVSEGTILVNDNFTNIYRHLVTPGSWHYYTLFVKFESKNGDLYYEPAARLAVMTPRYYGSVNDLYRRIPEFYRLLDGDMDDGYGGPLYRFLDVFGYEIDKIKTIIDYTMVMKDPFVANSEVLDFISQDLGIGLRAHELGPARLRTLINIIGFLRRSEGTAQSLELAIQALTGSDVEIDQENNEVKVYAQRVNLLKDPDIDVLVAGSLDGGTPYTRVYSYELDSQSITDWVSTVNSSTGEIPVPEDDTYVGGFPDSTGFAVSGQDPIWSYDPDPTSGGSLYVLSSLADYIMVKTGDVLYFSMQKDISSGVQDKIRKVKLTTYNGVSLVDVALSTSPIVIAGINYWKLTIADGYNDYINTYISIYVDSDLTGSDLLGQLLLERAVGGKFFNGDTNFGGWLVDSDTISDYRWYNTEDPNSSLEPTIKTTNTYSVYNSNYSKTRAVVQRMLYSYLPVTELTPGTDVIYYNSDVTNPKWTVTFNHIPGVAY